MNRRQFFPSVTAAGISIFGGSAAQTLLALEKDNRYRNEIGIQLYTLRNQLKADLKGTIQAVAKAGYQQVEPYGFPDRPKVIAAAKDAGLVVNSSHFEWNCVVNPEDKGNPSFAGILEKAKDAGLTHLVVPYLVGRNRKTLDAYKRVAENCNKAAELSKQAGIQLAYHNHAFEFEPKNDAGRCGFDVLIDEFSPDMHFEMDVFWIKAGGQEPVDMLKRLKGRVSQLHLKDLKNDQKLPAYNDIPKDAFEELGDGKIPMEPIIQAAAEAGVKHCHVEQDHSPDPIASIQKSIGYLKPL